MSFKILNSKTKKAQEFIDKYMNATDIKNNWDPFENIYDNCSYRKVNSATTIIHHAIKDNNGKNFRIVSFNTNFYTIGYIETKEEFNLNLIHIITPWNHYVIPVADDDDDVLAYLLFLEVGGDEWNSI